MTTTTVSPIPLDDIRNRFNGHVVYSDRDFPDAMRAHFPNTDPRVIEVVAYTANQDSQGTADGIYRCLENGFANEVAFLIDFEQHHPSAEGDRAQWENTTLICVLCPPLHFRYGECREIAAKNRRDFLVKHPFEFVERIA